MESLGQWAFFGVLLALIPVLANILDAVTREDGPFHFDSLFQRGELLIVASATVGAALADLYTPRSDAGIRTVPKFPNLRRVVTGFATLVLLGASLWFADIQAGIRDGAVLNHGRIAIGSVIVFVLALVSGIACVVVARLEKPA